MCTEDDITLFINPMRPHNDAPIRPYDITTEQRDELIEHCKHRGSLNPMEELYPEKKSKLPLNYFMNWFRDKLERNLISIDFHYSSEKYVSNFIDINEVKTWVSSTPIFISSQTGSGKNYFIQNTLIKKHLLQSNDNNNRMLILSNRKALNRQNKNEIADLYVKEGDSYYSHLREYYLPEGIDRYCKEFNDIDIFTYQQMYNDDILSKKSYRFIICDECHFFTSDSIFNAYTHNILKYIVDKGKNSIRLYMSATLEDAIEAIIREEFSDYDKIMTKESYKYHDKIRINTPILDLQSDKMHFRRNDDGTIHVTIPRLKILFYYMKRNYDYITPHSYNEIKDLFKKIKETSSSDNKWLIFVGDTKTGKDILEYMNNDHSNSQKSNSSVSKATLITSQLINQTSGKSNVANDEFDYIATNSKFNSDILISTSVLDNGINIKDTNVKNIIIDTPNKIEFIQMLGRVRKVGNNDNKLNLYFPRYDQRQYISFAKDFATDLINRLIIDLYSGQDKIDHMDKYVSFGVTNRKELFQKKLISNDTFIIKYNPCSIYALIEQLSFLINIIRKEDPSFCIQFDNNDAEAKRAKIVKYYTFGKGYQSQWSRSIVDILGSKYDMDSREEYASLELDEGVLEDNYSYTFTDTFPNYLHQTLIPSSIEGKIYESANSAISHLSSKEIVKAHTLIAKEEKRCNKQLSNYDRWTLIHSKLSNKTQKIISIFDKEIHDFNNELLHYNSLLTSEINVTIAPQLVWLERKNHAITEINDNDIFPEHDLNEYIINHAITQEDLNSNQRGKISGKEKYYYDSEFLKQHGIPCSSKEPTKEQKGFSHKFLNNDPLDKNLLNTEYTVNGKYYTLTSATSNGQNHTTYYLFIAKE